MPQFETVMRVSVSHPFVGLPSQSPKPVLHAATAHTPAVHAAVALGGLQRAPHAPQCEVLVRVSTSQPFEGSPSQSEKPGLQV